MLLLMINLPSRSNFTSTVAASDAVSWQHFHLSFPCTHQHSTVGCGGSNICVDAKIWRYRSMSDGKACRNLKNGRNELSFWSVRIRTQIHKNPPPPHLIHSLFIFILYPSHPLGKSAQKCDLAAWAMPI